jgi:hypothetical protein
MKRLVLLIAALLIIASQAQADEYRIYESGKPVVSRYIVKSRPDGSYSVYDSRQVVVPKYVIRPTVTGDGYKIYKAGKPVIPFIFIEKNSNGRPDLEHR